MSQKATTFGRDDDFSEGSSRYGRKAIEFSEAIVEEGVVGVDEFRGWARFVNEVAKVGVGLGSHVFANVSTKGSIAFAKTFSEYNVCVNGNRVDVVGVEPLPSKVVNEAIAFFVCEQAIDFAVPIGEQFTFLGERSKSFIWKGRPKKEREPRAERRERSRLGEDKER